MKILIAPDKFKGSCTAVAASGAIARGLRGAWPEAELRPIADGGEGFAEAVRTSLGRRVGNAESNGPDLAHGGRALPLG